MSIHKPIQIWHKREIELDQIYYLIFNEQERKMTDKELESFNTLQKIPLQHRIEPLYQMNPNDHPGYTPMLGRELITLAERKGLIPMFDRMFPRRKVITLISAKALGFFHEHSKWKGL